MSDTTTSTLAAALWDFDGTLADTEPLWIAAEYDLITSWEAPGRRSTPSSWWATRCWTRALHPQRHWPSGPQPGLGRGSAAWRRATRFGAPDRLAPGAIELLDSFAAAGVPCALVSASYRVLLDAALSQLPEGTFRVSVAGDEVSRGKPHPEPYEKACTALGVSARHCVVLEDSETGCRAGNAAGALVVAVPNRVEIPNAPRRLHVRSLADLDAAAVATMLEQSNAAMHSRAGFWQYPACSCC